MWTSQGLNLGPPDYDLFHSDFMKFQKILNISK